MMNWAEYEQEDKQTTVFPLIAWVITLAVVFGGALYAGKVQAQPVFVVQDQNITITFYDEPCTLKDTVTNLPYRVTWQEGDKTFEGCAAPRPDHQLVVAYFQDKTVALIPFGLLKKLTNA